MQAESFSLIVGATKLPISLVGKPALLSLSQDKLQIFDVRSGSILFDCALTDLTHEKIRTRMVQLTDGAGKSVNVFGTTSGVASKARQLIADKSLPALLTATQQDSVLPNAFEIPAQQRDANKLVTELLPQVLEQRLHKQ